MKISTWNLMRPTSGTIFRNKVFIETLNSLNADILVLTETNACIRPALNYFVISTNELSNTAEFKYSKGENRVTLLSKFPFVRRFETSDPNTTLCCEVLTPLGSLIFFGTIIGITGGKGSQFKEALRSQMIEIEKFSKLGNLCVIGDFNISYSGFPYPSHEAINESADFFESNGLNILTANISDSPDHIAVNESFSSQNSFYTSRTVFEKKITDHNLITVGFVS